MYDPRFIRALKDAHWSQVEVAVATTSTPLLPFSRDRIAVIFQRGVSNNYTVSGRDPAVLGRGMDILTTGIGLRLNLWTDGPFVHGPFWGIFFAAGETIAIWEAVSTAL